MHNENHIPSLQINDFFSPYNMKFETGLLMIKLINHGEYKLFILYLYCLYAHFLGLEDVRQHEMINSIKIRTHLNLTQNM